MTINNAIHEVFINHELVNKLFIAKTNIAN